MPHLFMNLAWMPILKKTQAKTIKITHLFMNLARMLKKNPTKPVKMPLPFMIARMLVPKTNQTKTILSRANQMRKLLQTTIPALLSKRVLLWTRTKLLRKMLSHLISQ